MASPHAPLSSTNAWTPLPDSAWNAVTAAHLLRRIGWTATPEAIDQAVMLGLERTLQLHFPMAPLPWEPPAKIAEFSAAAREAAGKLRDQPVTVEVRRQRGELRQKSREAAQALALSWLQIAAQPSRAAFEKWTLFLSDVYVTSEQKVKNAELLQVHQATLRRHALGLAPDLTKAVSRSPAMVIYLDLQESKREAPNENFAREMFELFVLGEGHYTENDIKEAARAFTGYRQRGGVFFELPRQVDTGTKTVFGHRGRLTGDEVIDLTYQQPAAATFLPRELVRFYLTSDGVSEDFIAPLGDWWRQQKFSLRALALRFFSSQAFFAPEWRGNYIKSPIQFYLGMLGDLGLDPLPAPRVTLNALRAMGQSLFDPPNVRGWVGGRQWINSSTLAARRQVAQAVVDGVPERVLNADELAAMKSAAAAGHGRFTLTNDHLSALVAAAPDRTAQAWIARFTSARATPTRVEMLQSLLDDESSDALRTALATLMQTPDYNLC